MLTTQECFSRSFLQTVIKNWLVCIISRVSLTKKETSKVLIVPNLSITIILFNAGNLSYTEVRKQLISQFKHSKSVIYTNIIH